MMRIQILSDLHFEFHRDAGRSFVQSLEPTGIDVLVLAGDIAVGDAVPDALGLFCRRFAGSRVIYVHGNHEFYGADRSTVVELCRKAERRHANLEWLDGSLTKVGRQRFLGTPLWFRPNSGALRFRSAMADFTVIRDFESWVYTENARALAFLERELGEGDIVVTHHLPSHASVARRFVGSPLNAYFVCDVEPLIRARRPRLWIHGHTHASLRYEIGPTTVLCNPFGYVGSELNPAFSERLVVDL
jgi:predicted phosphodiesterase